MSPTNQQQLRPQLTLSMARFARIRVSILILVLMTILCQCHNLTHAAQKRVDCRKVVFHPYCRGISAFQTHLQMKLEELENDNDDDDKEGSASHSNNNLNYHNNGEKASSDEIELSPPSFGRYPHYPASRSSLPRHQLRHHPLIKPDIDEAVQRLAPGLSKDKYDNIYEWKHALFNEYVKRNQIPPSMFIMKFGNSPNSEMFSNPRYNVNGGHSGQIEDVIMEDMFYGPNNKDNNKAQEPRTGSSSETLQPDNIFVREKRFREKNNKNKSLL